MGRKWCQGLGSEFNGESDLQDEEFQRRRWAVVSVFNAIELYT